MAWKSIMDQEHIGIRVDEQDTLLEVNSGGVSPVYVTLRLRREELDRLIEALLEARELTKQPRSGLG